MGDGIAANFKSALSKFRVIPKIFIPDLILLETKLESPFIVTCDNPSYPVLGVTYYVFVEGVIVLDCNCGDPPTLLTSIDKIWR